MLTKVQITWPFGRIVGPLQTIGNRGVHSRLDGQRIIGAQLVVSIQTSLASTDHVRSNACVASAALGGDTSAVLLEMEVRQAFGDCTVVGREFEVSGMVAVAPV